LVFFFFETGFCSVGQAVILLQPECWDYRCAPVCFLKCCIDQSFRLCFFFFLSHPGRFIY
jgi:hypothetical protein